MAAFPVQDSPPKPAVIKARHAVQIIGSTFDAALSVEYDMPGVTYDFIERCALVETPAGKLRARTGDWIIRDRRGRLHVFRAGFWSPPGWA